MNTQQLQYLVEIERTRSISQAAANLYMGQPNLSRILRDMESSVGYPIFERTRRGVRPTEKGAVFLQHARNILRELDFMQSLGPSSSAPDRFRICLPRSWRLLDSVQRFLERQELNQGLDAYIRECHPKQALDLLANGAVEIAVLRYCVEYRDYFAEQVAAGQFAMRLLTRHKFEPVVSADSPLAQVGMVSKADLEGYLELVHRDVFYPQGKGSTHVERKIHIVDRMGQIQFLQRTKNAYVWLEKLPKDFLTRNRLVQLTCADNAQYYQDALVYNPRCAMSEIERSYLQSLINGRGNDNMEIYQK